MEQHMVHPDAINGLFDGIIKPERSVLELGGGSGVLTREIYKNTKNIEVWELDKKYTCPVECPDIVWKYKDIMELRRKDIEGKMIIAFPPYECLEHILHITKGTNCILMISQKKLVNVGYKFKVLDILDGNDFTPVSSGLHYIVKFG